MSTRGIFFVDVDGTLVGPEGVADRVWPALAALRGAGWRVAICTGRPGRGLALDYARRADPDGLHVFESGAAVLTGAGQVVAAASLEPGLVDAALALAARHGVTAEVYTADGAYHAPARDAYIARHEALLALPAVDGLPPAGATIVRVQWVVPKEAWPSLQPAAEDLGGVALHVGQSPKMPDVFFVAVTRRGVSKAWGVEQVCAHFGVPLERAVMIGDAANDVPALTAVGTPLAVEGGAAEARAVADKIFPSAAEGGVADAAAWVLATSPPSAAAPPHEPPHGA